MWEGGLFEDWSFDTRFLVGRVSRIARRDKDGSLLAHVQERQRQQPVTASFECQWMENKRALSVEITPVCVLAIPLRVLHERRDN